MHTTPIAGKLLAGVGVVAANIDFDVRKIATHTGAYDAHGATSPRPLEPK